MSISLISTLWQPTTAALSSVFGGNGATASTSSSTTNASASGGATVASGGISTSQFASELQALLLQLQESGATTSGTATSASLSNAADGANAAGASRGHHHQHRPHEAGAPADIAAAQETDDGSTSNPTQLANQLASAG
jgi:hypothetical protein